MHLNGFSKPYRSQQIMIRPSVSFLSSGSAWPISGHLSPCTGRRCGASVPDCRKKRSRRYLESEHE